MKICPQCNKPFKLHVVIDNKLRNLGTRKYCLECSPFNTHNTRKLELGISNKLLLEKFCTKCASSKPISEFYQRRNGKGPSAYCKSCTNLQTIERQRELKKKAVEYLGSVCASCKCTGHPAIFDFHHKDPEIKDFCISQCKFTDFNKIIPELQKCLLLCSNCHRILHAGY